MWKLYDPAKKLVMLKQEAGVGRVGKIKGSLQHDNQVCLHLNGTSVSYVTVNVDSLCIFEVLEVLCSCGQK